MTSTAITENSYAHPEVLVNTQWLQDHLNDDLYVLSDSIRRSFQGLIDMGAKLQANKERVLYSGNLALLITEWTLVGTDPSGKSINLAGRGTIVFRRQPEGNWLMVIENPWGTE